MLVAPVSSGDDCTNEIRLPRLGSVLAGVQQSRDFPPSGMKWEYLRLVGLDSFPMSLRLNSDAKECCLWLGNVSCPISDPMHQASSMTPVRGSALSNIRMGLSDTLHNFAACRTKISRALVK